MIDHQPALNTAQGGYIVLDRWMLGLWEEANGKDLEALLRSFSEKPDEGLIVRAALACLVEAGLLDRESQSKKTVPLLKAEGELVSIIIVSYNSQEWLLECLESIHKQTYSPLEVIVVDNASVDGTAEWLKAQYGHAITLLELKHRESLAHAINRGLEAARGAYCLLLNPDVTLAEEAISVMVNTAQRQSKCAAIAAKLRLSWAPAFINGIGNYVGAFGWGTDSALGHLDLGQFDHWHELPSACFAAALIPAGALKTIGLLDEGFPLYYEDSEWCYRARLMGYHIIPAQQAVVYHAFSARTPQDSAEEIRKYKLQFLLIGRLRFITKILEPGTCRRFMVNYALEDLLRCGLALVRGHGNVVRDYLQAWSEYIRARGAIWEEHANIQSRRELSDEKLLDLQHDVPKPLTWEGLPLLTRDIIEYHYLPLLLSGKTQVMPEFTGEFSYSRQQPSIWLRAQKIQQYEGWKMLFYRIGKTIMFKLARP